MLTFSCWTVRSGSSLRSECVSGEDTHTVLSYLKMVSHRSLNSLDRHSHLRRRSEALHHLDLSRWLRTGLDWVELGFGWLSWFGERAVAGFGSAQHPSTLSLTRHHRFPTLHSQALSRTHHVCQVHRRHRHQGRLHRRLLKGQGSPLDSEGGKHVSIGLARSSSPRLVSHLFRLCNIR